MDLAEFAIAVGAPGKWVQNTSRILGRDFEYTAEEARRLGLVKRLTDALDVPLASAWDLAGRALEARAGADSGAETGVIKLSTNDDVVNVTVNLRRYLSDFTGRLSRAIAHYQPRRRGRPPIFGSAGAVERANKYGIDTTLLDESLSLTPGERLRRLERNHRFIEGLRSRDAA